MSLKRIFDVTITTLSPLHIGTGNELQRDFDYVTWNGRTWLLNEDAFLQYFQNPDGSFREDLMHVPASQLLEKDDYRPDNPLFRYVLLGESRSEQRGRAPVREQIKDVYDRPYLPGSSIKGALRTVLAWHLLRRDKDFTLTRAALGRGPKTADDPIEDRLFRPGKPDPQRTSMNHDLLRGLHVADTEPVVTDALRVETVNVLTGGQRSPSIPVTVEAIQTDTTFHTTFTLDEYLSSDAAEKKLQFGDRWQWLERLPAVARAWGKRHIREDGRWFRDKKYTEPASLLRTMARSLGNEGTLKSTQFYLQLGWGGGWHANTIGVAGATDEQEFESIIHKFNLSGRDRNRKAGDPFPKTRRAVARWEIDPTGRRHEKIVAPLGWCLVEMKERK